MENSSFPTRVFKVVDFSELPITRFKRQGPCSAQEFFEDVLQKEFKKPLFFSFNSCLIDLDEVVGYSRSFLLEVFSQIKESYGKSILKDRIKIKSKEEPHWIKQIKKELSIEFLEEIC